MQCVLITAVQNKCLVTCSYIIYSPLRLSCHGKWIHGENEEAVLKYPVRMRFLITYGKGDSMLDSLHCSSPIVSKQEWHSLNSACIMFFSLFMMKAMQLGQFNFIFG
jgi:hypothetical protein